MKLILAAAIIYTSIQAIILLILVINGVAEYLYPIDERPKRIRNKHRKKLGLKPIK